MLRSCARNIHSIALRRSVLNASAVSRGFCEKVEKVETEPSQASDGDNKLGGFAKAFEKHSTAHLEEDTTEEKLPDLPFATLLRNSKLVNVSKIEILERHFVTYTIYLF